MRNNVIFKSIIRSCVFSTLIFSSSVWADYIEPGDVVLKTEEYKPSVLNNQLGRYEYDMSWEGIPVGRAEVEVASEGSSENGKLKITARAKTTKFIDVFYKLRHQSQSVVNGKTLEPIEFSTFQTENRKSKSAKVSFLPNGRIQSKTETNGKTKLEQDFATDNLTLDPISAAFLAKSIDIEVGNEASFDVYNGKHRYLITFKVLGEEEVEVGKIKRSAFKIEPSIQKLTDTEGEDRFKGATLWVASDSTRDLLKLESEVFIGSVSAKLRSAPISTNTDEASIALAAKPQTDKKSRARLGD